MNFIDNNNALTVLLEESDSFHTYIRTLIYSST